MDPLMALRQQLMMALMGGGPQGPQFGGAQNNQSMMNAVPGQAVKMIEALLQRQQGRFRSIPPGPINGTMPGQDFVHNAPLDTSMILDRRTPQGYAQDLASGYSEATGISDRNLGRPAPRYRHGPFSPGRQGTEPRSIPHLYTGDGRLERPAPAFGPNLAPDAYPYQTAPAGTAPRNAVRHNHGLDHRNNYHQNAFAGDGRLERPAPYKRNQRLSPRTPLAGAAPTHRVRPTDRLQGGH